MADYDHNAEIEFSSAFGGAAPFCNKFMIHATPTVVRLAFLEVAQMAEASPVRSNFRSGVALSMDDARALVEGLTTILKSVEQSSGNDNPAS